MAAELKDDINPSDWPEGYYMHGSPEPEPVQGRKWLPVRGKNPLGNRNEISGWRLGPKPGGDDDFFVPPGLGGVTSTQTELLEQDGVDADKLKARRPGLDRRPRKKGSTS